MIKYTKPFLVKLENLLSETPYTLRYEKGQFQSGYCVIKDHKIIVINKFFPLEGRIQSLVEIIRSLDIDAGELSEKSKKLYHQLAESQLAIEPEKD